MTAPPKLLESARALIGPLAERAAVAEEARRLPPESVAEMAAAGLFDILTPQSFGGHEQSPRLLVEVVKEIGRGCGSSGWVLALLAFHNWLVARTAEDLRRRLFEGPRPLLLALTLSTEGGTAERVEGGYRLAGRWPWLSGIHHANRVALTARVRTPDEGAPQEDEAQRGVAERAGAEGDLRVMLLRPEQVEILDTWQMLGMSATGSHSVKVQDVFVPDHDALPYASFFGETPADASVEALYQLPMLPLFACVCAAPAVGIARAACERYGQGLREAAKRGAELKPSRLLCLADARMDVDAAAALLDRALIEMTLRPQGAPIETWKGPAWRLQASHCVRLCRAAVGRLFESSGLRAHARGAPLQRAFRDLSTLATHIAFDHDSAAQHYVLSRLGFRVAAPFEKVGAR